MTGTGSTKIAEPIDSLSNTKAESDMEHKDALIKVCVQLAMCDARSFLSMQIDLVVFSFFVFSLAVGFSLEADM